MYQSFEYKKSERDAYLVNVHGDHAELLKVNPAKGRSQHIMLTAPVEVIRLSLRNLIDQQGYKLCNYIDLSLRPLVD